MDKKDLRIIYLGTPDFAVESLKRLIEGGYNVVAVVTMPDKPIGRHQNHLVPSPIKEYALSVGLPVLQPDNLKDSNFIEQLRSYNADIQIVVAFRMLPKVVWDMPRLGTFNLHASLLPQYRGAAPINWAIINGDKETGITTFFLKHEIDTGDIIDQIHVSINDDETFGDIHDRLMVLGGDLVVKTIDNILNNSVISHPQSEYIKEGIELLPAPKIFRDTCRINISKNITEIHNFVRGLSPTPTAWTMLKTDKGELALKIYHAHKEISTITQPIGTIISDNKTFIKIALQDGYLYIEELQLSGKKKMMTTDFLRGYKFTGTESIY